MVEGWGTRVWGICEDLIQGSSTAGLKPCFFSKISLRGAEAPLFHVTAGVCGGCPYIWRGVPDGLASERTPCGGEDMGWG